MSMLEEIKAAEEAAALAKREAAAQAREFLLKSTDEANERAKQIILEAREKAKKTISTAEEQAKAQAVTLMQQRDAQEKSVALEARKNLPKASQYIVEKVVI